MKRLTGILLLFIFLFQAGGQVLLFMAQRQALRWEVERRIRHLPESALSRIVLSDKYIDAFGQQAIWEEAGKEFSLHGNWYDVVRTEKRQDSVAYFTLSDEKEEALLAELEEDSDEESRQGKAPLTKKEKPVKDEVFTHSPASIIHTCYLTLPEVCGITTPRTLAGYGSQFSPPPQA